MIHSSAARIDEDTYSMSIQPTHQFQAFVRTTNDVHSLSFLVRGAKCGGCLNKIESCVRGLQGVENARLNLSSGRMDVRWRGTLLADQISQAITQLGYSVSVFISDNAEIERKKEERGLLISMGVAGFAAANIMLLSISVWSGVNEMGEATRRGLHTISGLIALPVLLFCGRHFFISAWNALKNKHANMDVPISLALVLAYSVSVWTTLTDREHAYFDACVMLLFFLLIGRFLDARLRRRAYAAALGLSALQSSSVTRFKDDGHTEDVRPDEINDGDILLWTAGARAVVNMELAADEAEVDESLITGESLPHLVGRGSAIFAGAINVGPPVKAIALSTVDNSLLSEIAQMLEVGEQRKSKYIKLADTAVSYYVPLVHSIAFATFVGWLAFGYPLDAAIMAAVTTLIITCPCALALASPVTQMVAAGELFRKGVFLKSGDALERLAEVDHIVFDKTGTLTMGLPKLISGNVDPDILEKAAKLARSSRHPFSRALCLRAGNGEVAKNVVEHSGKGLEAFIDGRHCRLGSAQWIGGEAVDAKGLSCLYFCEEDSAPVVFLFEDQIQANTSTTIERLSQLGLSMEILSGDTKTAVEDFAKRVGLLNWTGAATPQMKVERLEKLRSNGRKTLMVGDGLNDAGALSIAHASLSPGGAMDISQAASDAVYGDGLASIVEVIEISRRTKRTLVQNFAIAALYNVIAVPIAVFGFVTPLIAAIAMSLSSLIVTLNALRLNVHKKENGN